MLEIAWNLYHSNSLYPGDKSCISGGTSHFFYNSNIPDECYVKLYIVKWIIYERKIKVRMHSSDQVSHLCNILSTFGNYAEETKKFSL